MNDMDRNAKLYVQKVTYNPAEGIYIQTTMPYFIRSDSPVYYPRRRCELEVMNCGEAVFGRIAGDLHVAQRSVDIITWGFDPGMVLVRDASGHGQRYGDLLIELAKRPKMTVRLVLWHGNLATMTKMKNNPGYYGRAHCDVGCLLKGYYNHDHEEYNAHWYERVRAGEFPNIQLKVRDVPENWVKTALESEKLPSNAVVEALKHFPSHHQKMLLIDYELPTQAVGYVMGHNSITDFWDTDKHIFQDPRRERIYKENPNAERAAEIEYKQCQQLPIHSRRVAETYFADRLKDVRERLQRKSTVAMPYQDVSARMRGPILYDLNHNFCQAWLESTQPLSYEAEVALASHAALAGSSLVLPALGAIMDMNRKTLADDAKKHPPLTMSDDFVKARKETTPKHLAIDGMYSIQLIRTQPMHGHKHVKECYANLNRQILHYLFIQNQYLQYKPWADHLIDYVRRLRARNCKNEFYLFLLTSTPEDTGMDLPTYDVAQAVGQSQTMTYEHEHAIKEAKANKRPPPIEPAELEKSGIHVVMSSLWTHAPNPKCKDDYEEIYIHAKVAIVDDCALTLGSANLNVRSMAMDSELNILSESHEIAYELRTKLFRQCLGKAGPAKFGDMLGTYESWAYRSKKNRQNIDMRLTLTGQVATFHVDRKPGIPIL